ncbi:TetR family transcriptional regulator [Bifidobacterium actinocoloniiforme DSM 22766]|uniref:TetR family transcriptional regulator n=1 Tax=Bifidobacterium actinocoloniiforme DSM 22766 TaxID=1437605 RepID=A0A086YZK8_9BIFI|nr:TetR/AcrR family transcriptional regulator [Bifidobacterium actinocoloniiforme]AKV55025.1 AcrR family transcriptional regulator [Bifidobacterium actinocoloniiforme DSM 22766]KFI39708.1 TetR family transcriptional regulator [Bifidobacterium actinocoloniiforme DSM 22766]
MARKVRKTPQARREEITNATARLVSEKGYNGITLKDVADAVGMSQPGVLHYAGSKEGLLSLIVTEVYAVYGTPEEFLTTGLPGSDPASPHFPAYLRYLVKHNVSQPELVQLFMVLQAESFDPSHPLHDYFKFRAERVWKHYSQTHWKLPEGMDWKRDMKPYVRMSLEAMDGIQLRWLREPPMDYLKEWSAFERAIYPSPTWDLYR